MNQTNGFLDFAARFGDSAVLLPIADHVEPGGFLILDGSLDGGVVDFVEIVARDAASEIVGLQPLKPAWHGVAADDRSGKNG